MNGAIAVSYVLPRYIQYVGILIFSYIDDGTVARKWYALIYTDLHLIYGKPIFFHLHSIERN